MGSKKTKARGDERAEKWKRYTDPIFQEELWERATSYLTRDVEPKNGTNVDKDEQKAVAAVFGWITLGLRHTPALYLAEEVLLTDPNYSTAKKDYIQSCRDGRQHLYQMALSGATFIGRRYSEVLLKGDRTARARLEKLIRAFETQIAKTGDSTTKRSFPKWHYVAGLAALYYLKRAVVPNREILIDRAIRLRCLFELKEKFIDEGAIQVKEAELQQNQPKNWYRVIRDLGLEDLPEEARDF